MHLLLALPVHLLITNYHRPILRRHQGYRVVQSRWNVALPQACQYTIGLQLDHRISLHNIYSGSLCLFFSKTHAPPSIPPTHIASFGTESGRAGVELCDEHAANKSRKLKNNSAGFNRNILPSFYAPSDLTTPIQNERNYDL